MDWTASAGAGVVPGLHGCLLGADADLARGRAPGDCPAQSEAWGRRGRALIALTELERVSSQRACVFARQHAASFWKEKRGSFITIARGVSRLVQGWHTSVADARRSFGMNWVRRAMSNVSLVRTL